MLIRAALASLALVACKSNPPAPAPAPAAATEAPAAWPPEDGETAPPPPGAEEVTRRMANALDGGRADVARDLFMNGVQVHGLLDCGGVDVAERVAASRDATVARVADFKGKTTFKGFAGGRIFVAKRDGALGPCTSRVDLAAFRARATWDVGGTPEVRDTMFLAVRGAWFFLEF